MPCEDTIWLHLAHTHTFLSHSSLWYIHPHVVVGRLDKRSIEREGRPRVSDQHAVVESDVSLSHFDQAYK